MGNLQTEILDAAMRIFARYGVKRTSMSDLCEEVGVSRQSLYNRFRNKDDILRGLIERYTDQAILEITQELQGLNRLDQQLDVIFQHMVVTGFDIVRAMPNAQEFFDGVNAVSQEALEQSAERFRAVIAKVLAPHEAALTRAGLSVGGLADFIQRAAKAAGTRIQDRDQFISQLRTLRQLCLAAAAADLPAPPQTKETSHGQGA